ncbi:MAG TPA: HAD family hydrolase [Terriglobales bacterium]|nr:HAD family hydrolase [Terriglobales bacterium]
MRWTALACDYDGTLASAGRVRPATLEALGQVRYSRRKLLLVTGRELEDLLDVFPSVSLFDRVVAENGAVIYDPSSRKSRLLAQRPPRKLVGALRARKVRPLWVGRVIVATSRGQQRIVWEAIGELALPLQVILNKRSLMVLPQGVNKATGLIDALHEIGVSPQETVGIGDAENDADFLALCGHSAAVANALPRLKRQVDVVTSARHGAGVVELVNRLLNGKRTRSAQLL